MKRTSTEELCRLLAAIAVGVTTVTAADNAGVVSSQSQGLHGYIGFSHDQPPAGSGYSAGMGFYAAVWPLIDQPLADFQIGLPSSWVTPDNSDNKDQPLAPEERSRAPACVGHRSCGMGPCVRHGRPSIGARSNGVGANMDNFETDDQAGRSFRGLLLHRTSALPARLRCSHGDQPLRRGTGARVTGEIRKRSLFRHHRLPTQPIAPRDLASGPAESCWPSAP